MADAYKTIGRASILVAKFYIGIIYRRLEKAQT